MTEISGRSGHRRHRRKHLSVAGSRTLLLLIILAVGIAGFAIGLNMARRDIAAGKQLIQQLQTESQNLETASRRSDHQQRRYWNPNLQAQTDMHSMKPAKNTYILKPNHSIVVGNGHLILGLIGSPENDSININVNGERHSAVPGDIISVAPDPSTACRMVVQLFDMFGARVTATCQAKS